MKDWRELARPVNLVMAGLTLVSIAVSLYVYYDAKAEGVLAYAIGRPIKVVEAPSLGNGLKVIDRHGQFIREDIFAREVVVWNAGDVRPSDEHVLRPFSIALAGARIVDAAVVDAVEPDVARFTLAQPDCGDAGKAAASARHDVVLFWCVFDPKLGARLRILYTGREHAAVEVDAYVSGFEVVDRTAATGGIKEQIERFWGTAFAAAMGLLLLAHAVKTLRQGLRWPRLAGAGALAVAGVVVLASGLGLLVEGLRNVVTAGIPAGLV